MDTFGLKGPFDSSHREPFSATPPKDTMESCCCYGEFNASIGVSDKCSPLKQTKKALLQIRSWEHGTWRKCATVECGTHKLKGVVSGSRKSKHDPAIRVDSITATVDMNITFRCVTLVAGKNRPHGSCY